jgi:multiple sugar transport system permease protein
MASIPTSAPIGADRAANAGAARRARGRLVGQVARTVASALIALLFFLPILWWGLNSIRTTTEIFALPPRFPFDATLDWYRVVLGNADPKPQGGATGAGSGITKFFSLPYLGNSFLIGGVSTLLVLLLATPAAYALSRFRLRRRKDIAFWILSQRMLPPVAAAYPLLVMFQRFGWVDTYHGLILVHTAINAPLAVLLLLSFFDEVPRELDDAAMIDGASRFGAFRQVILHYVRGGLMATAVLAFIFSWNEFLLVLVLTTGKIQTVPYASSTFTTNFATEWGYLAALGTASVVPIFVFILLVQRHLVRGLTLGAVK